MLTIFVSPLSLYDMVVCIIMLLERPFMISNFIHAACAHHQREGPPNWRPFLSCVIPTLCVGSKLFLALRAAIKPICSRCFCLSWDETRAALFARNFKCIERDFSEKFKHALLGYAAIQAKDDFNELLILVIYNIMNFCEVQKFINSFFPYLEILNVLFQESKPAVIFCGSKSLCNHLNIKKKNK